MKGKLIILWGLAVWVFLLVMAGLSQGRTITVGQVGGYDFTTIQAAIDDANDGDVIIVKPGTYTGIGNRDIDFRGKAITVRSTDPNNPNVVDSTIIDCNGTQAEPHRGFYFHSGEGPNSVLSGFTIENGYANGGGGICCGQSSPTITTCIIRGNSALAEGGGIKSVWGSKMTLINCLFWGNSAGGYGGAIADWLGGKSTIINCTFSGNTAECGGAVCFGEGGDMHIHNCILWGDKATSTYAPEIILVAWDRSPKLSIDFSDVQGGIGAIGADGSGMGFELEWGLNNIDTDPYFADPNNGDLHLKSQAGRWDANEGRWTRDDVTSPCIDAGDPKSPIGLEPFPNGGIINMGSFGGTAEASKSYFGEPVCETIVAGDINGDCKVNFKDFALMAFHWLVNNSP